MHIEGRIVSSINHVGKNIYIHMKKNGIGPLCYHTQRSTQNELKYEIKSIKLLGNKNLLHLVCMHAKLLQLCLTLCNPMDSSPPAPLSMGFSRKEYWRRLPYLVFPWKIIQGIFQTRDQTHISYICCIGRQILYC